MKTGHGRNQESLNWLFNSHEPIKSNKVVEFKVDIIKDGETIENEIYTVPLHGPNLADLEEQIHDEYGNDVTYRIRGNKTIKVDDSELFNSKQSIKLSRKPIKSGKYLMSPTDLAIEIAEYFDYKMPSRKQVADYMSDKFGTDKNSYSSDDFVDTLDSIMMELPYHCDNEIQSSRRPIKSGYNSDDSNVTEFYVSLGEGGYDGTVTVTKEEDGKWHSNDGEVFMGYLTPEDIVGWYDKNYDSAWLELGDD